MKTEHRLSAMLGLFIKKEYIHKEYARKEYARKEYA